MMYSSAQHLPTEAGPGTAVCRLYISSRNAAIGSVIIIMYMYHRMLYIYIAMASPTVVITRIDTTIVTVQSPTLYLFIPLLVFRESTKSFLHSSFAENTWGGCYHHLSNNVVLMVAQFKCRYMVQLATKTSYCFGATHKATRDQY